ncbi:FAD/NAD(P)-binding domain-containing protein [Neoconidiobolus thromboides FSU 785]|nr:FAD/NAD(P)-binding domain-containing protein [Neoconidiobolus thromboides FSU 785]
MYILKSSSKIIELKGSYFRTFSSTSYVRYTKERVMILGSGWGGFKLAKDLDNRKYDVTLISPRNYFLFTPLLASTSVGTLEFRTITETIRKHNPKVHYIEGSCQEIKFEDKKLKIAPNFDNNQSFDIGYDHLVVAVGAISNTFGIKGVGEHAHFLKDIANARSIRRKVMDCFEKAILPTSNEEDKQRLLNFAVVGGGPTGVEFSAELHDLLKEDMARLYPTLMPFVKMTLYDVAPNILSSFDSKLSTFATKLMNREGIKIKTGTSITEIKSDSIILKDGEEIPVGMVVWATGVTETPLIKSLKESIATDGWRLSTDDQLRLLSKKTNQVLDDKVYGIGDCATIQGNPLACTAQVAEQQATYLIQKFNDPKFYERPLSTKLNKPFKFNNKGIMAYLGNWQAIVELSDPLNESGKGKIKQSGYVAWFLWRSAYMTKSVSWRNKLLIPVYWFMTWAFGRDVSRF